MKKQRERQRARTRSGLARPAPHDNPFRLALAVLPRRIGLVPLAAGIGGFASVPMAALTFAGLFMIGGTAPLDAGSLVAAMTSVHTLIGVGEAVLTALVVGSVVAVRPDLVHGARRRSPVTTST